MDYTIVEFSDFQSKYIITDKPLERGMVFRKMNESTLFTCSNNSLPYHSDFKTTIHLRNSNYFNHQFHPGQYLKLHSFPYRELNQNQIHFDEFESSIKYNDETREKEVNPFSDYMMKPKGLFIADPKPINRAGNIIYENEEGQEIKEKKSIYYDKVNSIIENNNNLNKQISKYVCSSINYIDEEHKLISQIIDLDLQGKHKLANLIHDEWIKLKKYERKKKDRFYR